MATATTKPKVAKGSLDVEILQALTDLRADLADVKTQQAVLGTKLDHMSVRLEAVEVSVKSIDERLRKLENIAAVVTPEKFEDHHKRITALEEKAAKITGVAAAVAIVASLVGQVIVKKLGW